MRAESDLREDVKIINLMMKNLMKIKYKDVI